MGNFARPISHMSNHSWPGIPPPQFGRRPLGSATSLPPMLQLGLDDKLDGRMVERLNALMRDKEEKKAEENIENIGELMLLCEEVTYTSKPIAKVID